LGKIIPKKGWFTSGCSSALVKITKEELSVLKQKPEKIDIKFLKKISKISRIYTKKKTKGILL
jgi:hypothetical protein